MTFAEIHSWCRANRADVRGIKRGRDFEIRGQDEKLPADLPPLEDVFHWDMVLDDKHYPVSPSDMERLVSGAMTRDFYTGAS
jgi:hypothetical protein